MEQPTPSSTLSTGSLRQVGTEDTESLSLQTWPSTKKDPQDVQEEPEPSLCSSDPNLKSL